MSENFSPHNFRSHVFSTLASLKYGVVSATKNFPPIKNKKGEKAQLRAITINDIDNDRLIHAFAQWRDRAQDFFPSQFTVTFEGTKSWLENQVIKNFDRILFLVSSERGIPVGHLGLYRFDWKKKSCEIDNVIRGRDDLLAGIMTPATHQVGAWALRTLGVKTLYLRVLADNQRAVDLYERCGYRGVKRIPLKKEVKAGMVQWIEDPDLKKSERYFLLMRFEKNKK